MGCPFCSAEVVDKKGREISVPRTCRGQTQKNTIYTCSIAQYRIAPVTRKMIRCIFIRMITGCQSLQHKLEGTVSLMDKPSSTVNLPVLSFCGVGLEINPNKKIKYPNYATRLHSDFQLFGL